MREYRFRETIQYAMEWLADRYIADYRELEPVDGEEDLYCLTDRHWVYKELIFDEGEVYHPFYEIVRRSTALTAFANRER